MTARVHVVPATSLTPHELLTLIPAWARDGTRPVPARSPYSVVAIRGRRVVGYWMFTAHRISGRVHINSSYTYVMPALRRTGLAQRLWDVGIAAWKPETINVTVGSYAGYQFLRRAVARYARRGVWINVDDGTRTFGPNIYEQIARDVLQPPRRPRRRKPAAFTSLLNPKSRTTH